MSAAETRLVTLTVDGETLEAAAGEMLLPVLRRAGRRSLVGLRRRPRHFQARRHRKAADDIADLDGQHQRRSKDRDR